MKRSNEFARIAQIFTEKQSVSICLPNNAPLDAVAAATGLYLSLLQMGKQVSIASSEEVNPQFALVGQDKIQTNLSSDGTTLIVSFPYSDGAVDKVTYNIDGNRFNLLVQPKEGAEKLDYQKVKFSYSGGKSDVIVAIYAPTLESLGSIYENQKDKFTGVEIINIDRHFTNNNYGSVNIVDKRAASLSEMMTFLLRSINAKIDKDVATNLYAGIVSATNSFSAHTVTAQTFEASAFLMNNGAAKRAVAPTTQPSMNSVVEQQEATPQFEEAATFDLPDNPEEIEEEPQQGTAENKEVSNQGWLKPKIFQGPQLM